MRWGAINIALFSFVCYTDRRHCPSRGRPEQRYVFTVQALEYPGACAIKKYPPKYPLEICTVQLQLHKTLTINEYMYYNCA